MGHHRGLVRFAAVAGLLVLVLSGCTWVSRVSVDSNGVEANDSSYRSALSADGRYVVFDSVASNLVPGDTNSGKDVFLRDTVTGATTLVSRSSSGVQGSNTNSDPAISADGRYIAFASASSNLVPGDTNGAYDVFVRDTTTNTTTRVSLDSSGSQATSDSDEPSISADGRDVAFRSSSSLVPGDTGGWDVFVRDTATGTTTWVSSDSSGGQSNGSSSGPEISADGRYVVFYSLASDLVAGDTNGVGDIFGRDTVTGITIRISTDSSGVQGNDVSYIASVSAGGLYVAFDSWASNLVPGDTNGTRDVFVKDTTSGATTLVSRNTSGVQADRFSEFPAISDDGRYIAFHSLAANLTPPSGVTNDIFVRDTATGTTTEVSVDGNGGQADAGSNMPSISADGRYVGFQSLATNLVSGDTNLTYDVFVKANPTVTVSGVLPSSVPRGVATAVTITGTNFRPGSTVSVSGIDVAVTSVVVVDEGKISATLTPTPSAATGGRIVTVTIPGTGPGAGAGSSGVCGCLTIT